MHESFLRITKHTHKDTHTHTHTHTHTSRLTGSRSDGVNHSHIRPSHVPLFCCSQTGKKAVLQQRLTDALAEESGRPQQPESVSLGGLAITQEKPQQNVIAPAADRAPPPVRKMPEMGSPILEVHPNYHQVSRLLSPARRLPAPHTHTHTHTHTYTLRVG